MAHVERAGDGGRRRVHDESLLTRAVRVVAVDAVERGVGFFIGPKSHDLLNKVSDAARRGVLSSASDERAQTAFADPRLAESIDFGWWAVICRALLAVLNLFAGFVHNWGVAIILLTVLVKLLLFPLNQKQMASMEAMRRIQPQIQELQKKYADDREKLGMEQMKLFQENHVNPMGGCLPMLVQMPVWFALYRTLYSSFELYREPLFSVWLTDLTQGDPYYILPAAMGVTMFITQKMQPQMGDPKQAKMMLGKWVTGIRVLDETGNPPRFGRSALRMVLAFVSALPLFAGVAIALFSRRRQTLYDKLTGTYVVRLIEVR